MKSQTGEIPHGEPRASRHGCPRYVYGAMKASPTSQAGQPANASGQCPTSSPHRILIVDEERDLRRLYAEALAGVGYHVDTAADGTTGWAALKTNHYHLLITEHETHNLTGVELVKMLRAARMALPVVMAAGRLPSHELARNPSLQLAATLSKPFHVDALLDTVKKVLHATDSALAQRRVTSHRTSHAGGLAGAKARYATNPPPRILVVNGDIGNRQSSAEVLIRHETNSLVKNPSINRTQNQARNTASGCQL